MNHRVAFAILLAFPIVAGCNLLKKKDDTSGTTTVASGGTTATPTGPATVPPVATQGGDGTGGGGGAAPSTASYPAGEAGAKQLLGEFVKPGANVASLSKGLRPTSADYKALYDADTAKKLEEAYAKDWDSGRLVIAPKSGQTEVKLWSATGEELKSGKGNAKEFPGGYKRVAPHINAGQTLYRFKFVEPGKDLGMAFDGLAHVNGHWVIVPKPWRAVKGAGDD